jgi:signal peptidase I
MEIVATPRRGRSGPRIIRGVLVLSVLTMVLLLIPAALGLERHVVHDDAMAGTLSRGTLVFGEREPSEKLRVGDVITFRPPGGPDSVVTRRVVGMAGGVATTRGDAATAADPWLLPLDGGEQARMVVAVPWLGLPWLVLAGFGLLGWLLAGAGLVAAALAWRLRTRRRVAPRAGTPDAAPRSSARAAVR